jgi:hypothetical protein
VCRQTQQMGYPYRQAIVLLRSGTSRSDRRCGGISAFVHPHPNVCHPIYKSLITGTRHVTFSGFRCRAGYRGTLKYSHRSDRP